MTETRQPCALFVSLEIEMQGVYESPCVYSFDSEQEATEFAYMVLVDNNKALLGSDMEESIYEFQEELGASEYFHIYPLYERTK